MTLFKVSHRRSVYFRALVTWTDITWL